MSIAAVVALAAMGAFHGLNPGMGWLFAVAIGFQERSRAALLRALAPIAAGHALSIFVVAGLVGALQSVVAHDRLDAEFESEQDQVAAADDLLTQ